MTLSYYCSCFSCWSRSFFHTTIKADLLPCLHTYTMKVSIQSILPTPSNTKVWPTLLTIWEETSPIHTVNTYQRRTEKSVFYERVVNDIITLGAILIMLVDAMLSLDDNGAKLLEHIRTMSSFQRVIRFDAEETRVGSDSEAIT
jgi:hypothetical protein